VVATCFHNCFPHNRRGNAINDYFDAGIDAVNRPDRPIPSGRLRKVSAYTFSIVLFACGILTAYFIGTASFMIALFNSFLLYFYAFSLKREVFVGNLSVKLPYWFKPFLFGGAAYGLMGIEAIFGPVLPFHACHNFSRNSKSDRGYGRGHVRRRRNPSYQDRGKTISIHCLRIRHTCSAAEPITLYYGIVQYQLSSCCGHCRYHLSICCALDTEREPLCILKYFKVAMFFALVAFIAGSFFLVCFPMVLCDFLLSFPCKSINTLSNPTILTRGTHV